MSLVHSITIIVSYYGDVLTHCYPIIYGFRYVLLHHVMGELEGIKGAWAYVEGGMGAVSEAIARSAKAKGANIFVNMVSCHLLPFLCT